MNLADVFGRPPASIPDRYLVGDEQALLTVRRHWAELSRAATETVAVLVVGGLFVDWLPHSPITDAIALVMIGAVLRFCWILLNWRRTTISVSDKRLFVLSGVFTRRLSMMPLRKVTDMTLVQPLMGRLLGYGSIVVESAGQNQALSEVHFIPDALAFYRLIADLVFYGRRLPAQTDDTVAFEF